MRDRSYGLWALEVPGEVAFGGFLGILPVPAEMPFAPAIEIGWRLARPLWGRGLASEAARAVVERAFGALELGELVAYTAVGNERSRRLMVEARDGTRPRRGLPAPGLPPRDRLAAPRPLPPEGLRLEVAISSNRVRALHQHRRPGELNDRFRVPIESDAGTHRFNIAPTEEVLAIVTGLDGHAARMLRWGLVPPWAKDLKGSGRLINARMETVTTTPAYRALIPKGSRRALQLADGYFEWLAPERRGSRAELGPRQPFFFQVDGGVPFAFASLWTPAKIAGGVGGQRQPADV